MFSVVLGIMLQIKRGIEDKLEEVKFFFDSQKVLVASSNSQIEEELTEYEKERLVWEDAFDTRIDRLKEELASKHSFERQGTPAQELHPLVKNIPHNSVNTYENLPDVEYAE